MFTDELNDTDQEYPEDFSPEPNLKRSKALENNSKRVYEQDRE